MKTIELAIAELRRAVRVLTATDQGPCVRPEVGRFYETRNGSLVLVVRAAPFRTWDAVVVSGGSGDVGRKACGVGERYRVEPTGEALCSMGWGSSLMDLCREVSLEQQYVPRTTVPIAAGQLSPSSAFEPPPAWPPMTVHLGRGSRSYRVS